MSEDNKNLEAQAAQQTGQAKVRLRVDQRDMNITYANSFRPIPSTEEFTLDFGINQTFPVQDNSEANAEIVFGVDSRIVMNYYTAKRLALSLNETIAKYEEQFGELKLNANDRRVKK